MKRFLYLPAALLVLSVAVSARSAGDEWELVSPNEAKIVFEAPGFVGTGRFAKRSTLSAGEHVGVWLYGSLYPRAQIYLQELHPDHVRRDKMPLERALKSWKLFRGKSLDLGVREKAVNVLGRVEYRRFSVEELHCVGFGQHFGVGGRWDNDRGIPPHYITGYYCDAEPLADGTVEAVVQALGVRGYKTPGKSE